MNITIVILCGGLGTRLWPLSRKDYPKQFLSLTGALSSFQETINRFLTLEKNIKIDEFLIIANETHRHIIIEQLKFLDIKVPFRVILEPESKNTAPSLTLAALAAYEKNNESILVVSPSDHYVKNNNSFIISVNSTLDKIENNTIFTLGVKAIQPETELGYIQFQSNRKNHKKVLSFKEKPNFSEAKKMIKDGCYAWNLGVFILKSKTWLDSIFQADYDIFNFIKMSWNKKTSDNYFERPDSKIFYQSPSNSIDYVVMEKFKTLNLNVELVIIKTLWSDLGTFSSFDNIFNRDSNRNIFKGDIISYATNNTIAFANKRNISLLGVDDLIIIETVDSVLVANKKKTNSIKKLIEILHKDHEYLLLEHIKVNRPWGWFEIIDYGSNFKVKKILVRPGEKLSYQSHKLRNEHWIVVKGTATIICDGSYIKLYTNESTYIKAGIKHQLSNFMKEDLIIIEVQTGSKVIEEDIKRFEDSYGRM